MHIYHKHPNLECHSARSSHLCKLYLHTGSSFRGTRTLAMSKSNFCTRCCKEDYPPCIGRRTVGRRWSRIRNYHPYKLHHSRNLITGRTRCCIPRKCQHSLRIACNCQQSIGLLCMTFRPDQRCNLAHKHHSHQRLRTHSSCNDQSCMLHLCRYLQHCPMKIQPGSSCLHMSCLGAVQNQICRQCRNRVPQCYKDRIQDPCK